MELKAGNIYMAVGATDLRKGIDGYAQIVQSACHRNPMDSSLYIFCNRNHNKIKCLYWDGSGFWLLYKHLEKDTSNGKSLRRESLPDIGKTAELAAGRLKVDQKTSFEDTDRTGIFRLFYL